MSVLAPPPPETARPADVGAPPKAAPPAPAGTPAPRGRRPWVIALVVLIVLALVGGLTGALIAITRPSTSPQPAPATFGTITSYPVPGGAWGLTNVVVAPNGSIYFASVSASSNAIAVLNTSGQMSTITVPGTALGPIAFASNGTMFTSAVINDATYVLKFSPGSTDPTRFQVPPLDLGTSGVRTVFPIQAMAVATNGTLWFERGQLNRWDTQGGYTSALGTLTAGGAFAMFPFADRFYSPGGIVIDPNNGNVWFSATCVCARNGYIEMTPPTAKLDSTGKLAVSKYTVPAHSSTITGIAPHPSRMILVGNNLWFVEQQDNYATEQPGPADLTGPGAVGFMPLNAPSNSGIVEYPLKAFHSRPTGLTLGGDGNLWIAESGTGKLARMNTQGQLLSEYTVSGSPDTIVTGQGGNVYYTTGGAVNWNMVTHTVGLTGNQFPAWNPYPTTVAKFQVK